MHKKARIFVAGHGGLVGSALVRTLQAQGFQNIIVCPHKQLDLRYRLQVAHFFAREKPEYVFLAAARVGGIDANNAQPVEFLLENLQIGTSVIATAAEYKVKKLLYLGSSCIYPRECPQPMKEEYLLTGKLEPTNQWYALAKISCLKLCEAYRRQYGSDFISVMPTNLYGVGDNYKPGCHVIPALIKRFHEANQSDDAAVKVWGSGGILREFLYVDDLARACVLAMQKYSEDLPLNIGSGTEVSIKELAETVAEVVGLDDSRLVYDSAQLTGTPRKLLDSTRILNLGWRPRVSLLEGLHWAFEDFLSANTK